MMDLFLNWILFYANEEDNQLHSRNSTESNDPFIITIHGNVFLKLVLKSLMHLMTYLWSHWADCSRVVWLLVRLFDKLQLLTRFSHRFGEEEKRRRRGASSKAAKTRFFQNTDERSDRWELFRKLLLPMCWADCLTRGRGRPTLTRLKSGQNLA